VSGLDLLVIGVGAALVTALIVTACYLVPR
jgi:hypothetical protein